jgi:Ran GTPase-activating protein (RanGAP) involved in mRNA processing and transport
LVKLSGNQIPDAGIMPIAGALRQAGSAQSLRQLDLARNHIGSAGAAAMAQTLVERMPPNLQELDLSRNAFSGSEDESLTQILGPADACRFFAIVGREAALALQQLTPKQLVWSVLHCVAEAH